MRANYKTRANAFSNLTTTSVSTLLTFSIPKVIHFTCQRHNQSTNYLSFTTVPKLKRPSSTRELSNTRELHHHAPRRAPLCGPAGRHIHVEDAHIIPGP
jgi:hypothetical protein